MKKLVLELLSWSVLLKKPICFQKYGKYYKLSITALALLFFLHLPNIWLDTFNRIPFILIYEYLKLLFMFGQEAQNFLNRVKAEY